MNEINSDEDSAPKTVNEVHLEAMTWINLVKPENMGSEIQMFTDAAFSAHPDGKGHINETI